MQHFIKAIGICLSLFFCASPLMAQFPKVPKIKVPKVAKDKSAENTRDAQKGATKKDTPINLKGTGKNNSPENRKQYQAYMDEAAKLSNDFKYLEAVPLYEKAAAIAPTQSEYSTSETDQFKTDAEKSAASCKKADADCKVMRKKIDELANAKKYDDAFSELRKFCPGRGAQCECLMLEPEKEKIKTDINSRIAADKKAAEAQKAANEEKALAEKYAPKPDAGITGSLHQKYLKQIVFSKKPIDGNSPESELSNSFNLGDDIFFRLFLERSLANDARAARIEEGVKAQELKAEIHINGTKIYDNYEVNGLHKYRFNYENSTSALEALSHNKWVELEGDNGFANEFLTDFFYATNRLPVGSHKVKIVLPKLNISGEFTLNVTEAGKLALAKKLCVMPVIQSHAEHFNKGLKIVTNGAEVIKTAPRENSTFVKVVETASDWVYHKNRYGIITHRTLYGRAFYKYNDTGLYYSKDIEFYQENTSSGGSKYGKTTWGYINQRTSYAFHKDCVGK